MINEQSIEIQTKVTSIQNITILNNTLKQDISSLEEEIVKLKHIIQDLEHRQSETDQWNHEL